MDDRNHLRISTGNAIDGRKFTHAKRGDQGRYSLDAGITIGSICYPGASVLGTIN
jgi:hypothetical protein